jgi:hypothetical protein
MNLIRKSGRTELVLNIKDLPNDMQEALQQAGMGRENLGILGAYHPETKNVYIFLPEFTRQIKGINPKVDLSSRRAERLIINRLLNTIEHENLHLVMDDDIHEFAVKRAGEFIEELVIPNTMEYIMSLDDIETMAIADVTLQGMRPIIKDMLENTGKNLIHEIMVRMVMQYDNKKIIDDLTPYLREYIQLMLSNMMEVGAPMRMFLEENQLEAANTLLVLMINALPNYWANLMRQLFLNNNEVISDFMQWNLDAVMNPDSE